MTLVGALKTATTAALFAAGVLTLAGCGSSHVRFQNYLASGQRYLAAGNLDKASIEFRNALQIEPQNADAFYYNGQVAERRGNLREAVDYYQGAVDAQPKDDRCRAALAKVFVLAGATQQALAIISPGLLEHPDNPDLLAARAAVRHQLKDDGDARNDAERAVQLAQANENAIAVLAALALRAGEHDRAISLVGDAIAKAPGSIDLHRIFAAVYLASGQPEKAEEQMRKVIALEPMEMTPRLQLVAHFGQVGNLDAAQQVLEAAVRDLPQRDDAKLALVDFVTTQRSRAQGERILRDFIAKDPDDQDLKLGLGTLLQRSGAKQEALATYREVIQRDGRGPKGLAARDRIAALDLEQGREAEARQLIEEVLTYSPRDDDALILRANLALQHDDPTNAIVDLRVVLHDQPHSVVLHRTLARAYIDKGEPAMAEEALRASVVDSPGDVGARIELARFFVQTDRATQAVTLLRETAESSPDNADVREALVRAYMADRDLSSARNAAEQLKKLRPDGAQGYFLAGLIAHDEGRLDDSEQNLEHALTLEPGSLEIHSALTRYNLERGRAAVAIARLQKTLEHEPNNVPLLDLLGSTYFANHDMPHAVQSLEQAAKLDPHGWQSFADLAKVKLALGDTTAAVEYYKTAIELAPAEPVVVSELAALYEKQGRTDAAIACYEALYQHGAGARPFAANNLAMLLVTYKTDRASLDRARTLTAGFAGSSSATYLDTLGWVRFKRKEYRDAVVALERAADRAPDSKVIKDHLASAEASYKLTLAEASSTAAGPGSANPVSSEQVHSREQHLGAQH
jgi:tetratricopeptide (TPR) repeat protein